MIELRNDALEFSFPEVHESARLTVHFQRTLRIPDDGKRYPLPPGLGRFPLRHVDDFAARIPEGWMEHGGVMMPMYQSEALWLCFNSRFNSERDVDYPFAVKIATGKVNAVSGKAWENGIHKSPQDYVSVPAQPWLDGYCVEKGVIRQFVAMPLGAGYTAEEQLTGKAQHGGLQILAYPMKREAFEKHFPKGRRLERIVMESDFMCCSHSSSMGLAPGGRMKQSIIRDAFAIDDWDLTQGRRCFVHIANSLVWNSITGKQPPSPPPTSEVYTSAGLPWFDWYDDQHEALEGADALSGLKSVVELGKEMGDVPLPENTSVEPEHVIELRRGLKSGQVREWRELSPRA